MIRVCVVGAGYVGLVTGVGLAEHGHDVTLVDADAAKVDVLNAARSPIFEEGLDRLLHHHGGDRLRAVTDLSAAVSGSDLTLVCVGTPSRSDGSMDTTAIEQATAQVGAALGDARRGSPSVVVKSTVVPGTTDGLLTQVLERSSGLRAGVDFGVGSNPEFLTEGQAVADFLRPDRIIIGGDEIALTVLRKLYSGFVGVPVVETNSRTTEMIKYVSNAMLATAISFSNEMANLGAAVGGIDPAEVMRGVHLSRYLTTPTAHGTPVLAGIASFYEAGCGYGGSCLPKDVAALSALGREIGSPMRVLEAAAAVNDDQPGRLVAAVEYGLGCLARHRIAVLGLAFKPDTDDVRCSPALPVLRALVEAGAEVVAHDPVVGPAALAAFGLGVSHEADLAAAVKHADAIMIVTRWSEYLAVPELVAGVEPPPLVVDGRRLLDRQAVTRYAAVGLRE